MLSWKEIGAYFPGVSMSHLFNRYLVLAVFGLTLPMTATSAESPGKDIASRTGEIEGMQLHYLTAGSGPTLILLHGYAETSRMWKPIIPLLAERFTVIAPDLPGIGDSAITTNG